MAFAAGKRLFALTGKGGADLVPLRRGAVLGCARRACLSAARQSSHGAPRRAIPHSAPTLCTGSTSLVAAVPPSPSLPSRTPASVLPSSSGAAAFLRICRSMRWICLAAGCDGGCERRQGPREDSPSISGAEAQRAERASETLARAGDPASSWVLRSETLSRSVV